MLFITKAFLATAEFTTSKRICNLTFGNPSVFTRSGFQVNYRRQSSHLWQSSLATGTVPAYSTAGFQLQYNNKNENRNIKSGAVNLLNRYYYSFTDSPSIGGLYYCTTTINSF